MTAAPTAATLTFLEKVAVDNGFDQALQRSGAWLMFAAPTDLPISHSFESLRNDGRPAF